MTAPSGTQVLLDASPTTDPDGDEVSFHWYPYREAGTFPLTIYYRNFKLENGGTPVASFVAPKVTEPRTIHFILEAGDNGEPALTAYRRVIVTITPPE